MPSHFLYRIQPSRAGFLDESTPEEDGWVAKHFAYLKTLTEQGIVLLAGRTLTDDADSHGLVLFGAESEEAARAVMEEDPAVAAGVFRAELFPFRIALVSKAIVQREHASSERAG